MWLHFWRLSGCDTDSYNLIYLFTSKQAGIGYCETEETQNVIKQKAKSNIASHIHFGTKSFEDIGSAF